MNSNLTQRASNLVYKLAQQEAKTSGSEQVLPEHVLIALIKSKDGNGYTLLEKVNIDIDEFLETLEGALIFKPLDSSVEVIPISRRLGTILDLATIEAQSLGDCQVGTEHIVLATAREGKSVITVFFESHNIKMKDLRSWVRKIQSPTVEPAKEDIEKAFNDFLFKNVIGDNDNKIESKIDEILGTQEQSSTQKSRSHKEESSFLSEFSRDITKLAREEKADPVVGRNKEIRRIIQILSRRNKNNPILIGEPGVGKTAIVEGLAQKIAKNEVPHDLLKKRILSLDLAALIAGTKYRGEFEERMKRLMKEIREDKNIILFIDELHTIIGAGGPEGSLDASNILKPALSRGEIQIIGATTTKEYNKYIEKDSALERRFQTVKVDEPTDVDTEGILSGIKKKYEAFHNVIYDDDVIPLIVKLSRRYIPERYLPDKAIDLLDEVGAA